jgi:hypothetical protein
MLRRACTAALSLVLSIAGGCASAVHSSTEGAFDDGLDRARMAQIERAARAHGVTVHWVNPPRRPS